VSRLTRGRSQQARIAPALGAALLSLAACAGQVGPSSEDTLTGTGGSDHTPPVASGGGPSGGGPGGGGSSGGVGGATSSGGAEAVGGGLVPHLAVDLADSLCVDWGAVPTCSAVTGHSLSDDPPTVLATAEELIPGARFTRVGRESVVLELPELSGSARYRVVTASPAGQPLIVQEVVMPSESPDWELRHVWESIGVIHPLDGPSTRLALACSPTTCHVLESDDSALPLVPRPGSELPADVHSLVGDYDRLCAYGRALHCLDGTRWVKGLEVPTDGSTLLAKVVLDSYLGDERSPAVAVTDAGTLLVEESGRWSVQSPPLPGDPLASLESHQGVAIALYESGLLRLVDRGGVVEKPCPGSAELVFALPELVVDDEGRGYEYEDFGETPGWCLRANSGLPNLVPETWWGCGRGVHLTLGATPEVFVGLYDRLQCLTS